MNGGYKLKLCSKKLRSGRCQIKFYVTPPEMADNNTYYGYMLADAGSTLREVVSEIEDYMMRSGPSRYYNQDHLFNLGRRQDKRSPIYFFKES